MEPFDLENDYEEGHFDEETGEFYFKSEKQQKRRRMTKEDHIYGDFISVNLNLSFDSGFQRENFWDNRDSRQSNLLGEDDEDYGDEQD